MPPKARESAELSHTEAEPSEADEEVDLAEDLAAICIDANAMSQGRLNIKPLEDLVEVIESQELEIEVWIPEPVVWEWAEHLSAELLRATETYDAVQKQVESARIDDLIGPRRFNAASIDDIVDQMIDALEGFEGVSVLRVAANPSAAIEGLRDQVLVRGAARRKSNVKTGGADATSFRMARAELALRGGSMVMVSGDQDATRFFAHDPNVLVLKSLSRSRAGVVRARTGSERAASAVREAITATLTRLRGEDLDAPVIEHYRPRNLDSRLQGRLVQIGSKVVAIDEVESVRSVSVSWSDGYGSATVEAIVSVERTKQVINDLTGEIDFDVDTFDGRHALVELSAQNSQAGEWEIAVDSFEVWMDYGR